jgi:hypothetical protein
VNAQFQQATEKSRLRGAFGPAHSRRFVTRSTFAWKRSLDAMFFSRFSEAGARFDIVPAELPSRFRFL